MTQQYKGFFVDSGTLKIDLEEDHWVEIQTEMSIGDWERYEAGMLQIIAENEADNSAPRSIRRRQQRQNSKNNTHIKMSAGLLELLEINIKSWSFENVPVNRANISKLRNTYANRILEVIQEQNPENPLDPTSLEQSQT